MKIQKSVFKSKTFYFGILSAFAPMVPAIGTFMAENSASVGMVWGALSILLRFATKEKVVLID